MIVWKCVLLSGHYKGVRVFESAGAVDRWNRYYKVGERVEPVPGSKLFAFDTLKHAMDFIKHEIVPAAVLKCETSEWAYAAHGIARFTRDLDDYWQGKDVETRLAPNGTVLVPWVEVLEVAYEWTA